MYSIHILEAAKADLASLDESVGRLISRRPAWLAANADNIRHRPLTGQFARLNKLRVADYRIIYEIIGDERVILIHRVGHRRDIYRGR